MVLLISLPTVLNPERLYDDYFNKALDLEPHGRQKSAEYIRSLAVAYYESGELEKAVEECLRITQLTTGRLEYGDIYAKSFYMLGKIHEEQGKKAEAIEFYTNFLSLWKNADPGLPEVEEKASWFEVKC